MRVAVKCLGGFPKPEDKCENEAGPTSKFWCDSCNRLRAVHIDNQFRAIEDKMVRRK